MRGFVLVALLLPLLVFGEVFIVDTTGSEGDSLQEALDNAWSHPGIDTVLLLPGTYHCPEGSNTGFTLYDSTVLMGESFASCTLSAFSADSTTRAYHVIYCSFGDSCSHTSSVKNLVVRDGAPMGAFGGGFYLYRSSLTIDSCIVEYNMPEDTATNVDRGGGLYAYGSEVTVRWTEFRFNGDTMGVTRMGGGLCAQNSVLQLEGDLFIENCAIRGGGLFLFTCIAVVENCEFLGNLAQKYMGGIYIRGGEVQINNCFFGMNDGILGTGAVGAVDSAGVQISDCMIYSNFSEKGISGAVSVGDLGTRMHLKKSVIAGNYARLYGGAFTVYQAELYADSCLIVDNATVDSVKSGLARPRTDDTLSIVRSNAYYNTFQSDVEYNNLASFPQDLTGNFWWIDDSASIQALVEGPADISGFSHDFLEGVPGEPQSVFSVRNYDETFTVVVDSIGEPQPLNVRLQGVDRNPDFREVAVVILRSSACPDGIASSLVETGKNTGIYEGQIDLLESTGSDTVRKDDAMNVIRVRPQGDTVFIISNVDTNFVYAVGFRAKPPMGVEENGTGTPSGFMHDLLCVGSLRIPLAPSLVYPVRVRVYSADGRQRAERSLENPSPSIVLEELPSGLYFIVLESSDKIVRYRAILLR